MPGMADKLVQTIRNDYSSTNVTTSAYVELDASLNGDTAEMEVWDTSGEEFILAKGEAGSEVDWMRIGPGGLDRQRVKLGEETRLSIKAVSANATTGVLTMNLWR